jgi:hypothetical protein
LAVLKLAVLVSGVLALAKLGFLDFITGGFITGRFGGLPNVLTYSLDFLSGLLLIPLKSLPDEICRLNSKS